MTGVGRTRSGDAMRHHPPDTAEQRDQSENHRERIVVEKARLQPAHSRRDALHERRRAVDRDAVDDRDIAALPEAATERDAAAREDGLIYLVEPVLVREELVKREK